MKRTREYKDYLDRSEGIGNATIEAIRLGCGFVMLGHGNFALVDKGDESSVDARRWYKSRFGYAVRFSGGKVIWMHRQILGVSGRHIQVDHINRNKLDNRRSNLRVSDARLNQGNRPKPNCKNPTSKFKGVYWSKSAKKFYTQIRTLEGKRKNIFFEIETDAAKAYNKYARYYFGEHAFLNKV